VTAAPDDPPLPSFRSSDAALTRAAARVDGDRELRSWEGTRDAFLRALGFLYVVAFAGWATQYGPLVGADGLTPAGDFLDRVAQRWGGTVDGFLRLPSVFWLDCSDGVLGAVGWIGAALGGAVMLGLRSWPVMLGLWGMYLSIVHVGQAWYGYGWETMLLETGFLAVFLCPLRNGGVAPPARPVLALLRWELFRLMIGAGLIKLRGDPCWRDLTCLATHYETQPVPNPLSWWLHHQPLWFHRIGVGWNHVVELLVPWLLFAPARLRHLAGVLLASFQVGLIVSGNLSWLNWLTLVLCLVCFDDTVWRPRHREDSTPSRTGRIAVYALVVLVAVLSVPVVQNMLSPNQAMNTSFNRLHLVNSYGAFGSIDKIRRELVIQGTQAQDPTDPEALWRDYEMPCKPGALDRRPCVISPWHYRLDWQIWFAYRGDLGSHPWLVHVAAKLLEGDPEIRELFEDDPFGGVAPRFVRIVQFEYAFTDSLADGWWTREAKSFWLPPVSLETEALQEFLAGYGWTMGD
jgi:hypothetical protein